MEPITLIIASLISVATGAKLMPERTVKSDSYTLSQIKDVVLAMEQDSFVTGIERLIPVSVNGEESATMYDLNGNEGYLVLGENYKIFDYQKNVELVDELPNGKLEFNPISKTFTTSRQEPFVITENLQRQQLTDFKNIEFKEPFEDYGCGRIEKDKLIDYIQAKFPGGTLDDEFSLPIRRNTQDELSVYKKEWDEGAVHHYRTEGNCWLCASYTIFDYLINQSAFSLSSFNSFPRRASIVSYYPRNQEPVTYNWVRENDPGYRAFEDYTGDYKVKELNNVYIALRHAGIAIKPSCPIDGLSLSNTANIMQTVAHNYGLSSFYCSINTSFNHFVGTPGFKQFLNDDKPMMFSSSGSTYGNHDMIVSGYKYYKRTVRILFWDKIEWATFLEIGDGESLQRRYFDITRYYWEDLGEGAFITYEF